MIADERVALDEKSTVLSCEQLDGIEKQIFTPRGIAGVRAQFLENKEQLGFAHAFVPVLEKSLCAFEAELTRLRNQTATGRDGDHQIPIIRWSGKQILSRLLDMHLKIVRFDPILSEEIGREGSHRILLRILKLDLLPEETCSVEDQDALIEIQDLAGQVAAGSSGFPLPTTPYDAETLKSRLPLFFSTLIDGEEVPRKADGIFIHQVTTRQREQEDVGFLMWPSAVALSQWLIQNYTNIQDKKVLELGAGCGLAGLVAAQLNLQQRRQRQTISMDYDLTPCTESSIIMTDFNPQVLENLHRNVVLNGLANEASVVGLDFYQQTGESPASWIDVSGKSRHPVDIVLGADIICKPDDAWAVAKTVHDCLVGGGKAVLISASSKHRFGVDHLEDACVASGLIVRSVESVDRTLVLNRGNVLEDLKKTTGYVDDMDLLLFQIEKVVSVL